MMYIFLFLCVLNGRCYCFCWGDKLVCLCRIKHNFVLIFTASNSMLFYKYYFLFVSFKVLIGVLGIRHNGPQLYDSVCISFSSENITVFGLRQVFLESIPLWILYMIHFMSGLHSDIDSNIWVKLVTFFDESWLNAEYVLFCVYLSVI